MRDARTLQPARLDRAFLLARARLLVPHARIASVRQLNAPDFYWYDLLGGPPLPVLRITFDDPAGTWVHVDPQTGRLLGAVDRRGRVFRWLYGLLHKWDVNPLILHRPAWEFWIWTLSLVGIAVSLSGAVIGWRRLRHR